MRCTSWDQENTVKPVTLVSTVLIVACARDSRPPAPPPTVSPTTTNDRDIQNLDLGLKQVDGLPISELVDPGAATRQPVKEAIAILHPTAGNQVSGTVRFVDVEGLGIEVFAVGHGLMRGPHAFHVHAFGDCSAPDASSAGPHFHFTGSSFDKEVGMITGNLGQLTRHQTGPTSTYQGHVRHASLQGDFSIIGRSVVIHELGNDPDVTPDGGAGARLACGVIGVANPGPPQHARK